MDIRTATASDIPSILSLQAENLITNLAADNLQQGFVTTPFTPEQMEEVMADGGLYVAFEGAQLAAYLFVGTWQYYAQWPIFPFMNSRFPLTRFQGKPITLENSFQYGPICVSKDFRGSGVFLDIFEQMRIDWGKRFAIGGTFINKLNHRSMHAHTVKMGWQVIDEFSYNSHHFCTLAYDMQRPIYA